MKIKSAILSVALSLGVFGAALPASAAVTVPPTVHGVVSHHYCKHKHHKGVYWCPFIPA